MTGGALRSWTSALRADIAAKDDARAVLAAQRDLRDLWKGVGAVGNVQEADALADKIRALSDAHRETQVERTATEHLQTISALKSVLP